MATLTSSFCWSSTATAIIVPSKPSALKLTFTELEIEIAKFQVKLAALGISPGDPISIALPNSCEFIVSFLATARQRAIAAPINPFYKEQEFAFYVNDLGSILVLVPQGAVERNDHAVRASRMLNCAVAECYWNGKEVVLDVKELGRLSPKRKPKIETAEVDDVALVLHTSGSTGRPKAVRPFSYQNC